LDNKANLSTTSILWSTFLQGGKDLSKSFVKSSKNLLNEPKIQLGSYLATFGFISLPNILFQQNKKHNWLIFKELPSLYQHTPMQTYIPHLSSITKNQLWHELYIFIP
jgi:hypothetical protein